MTHLRSSVIALAMMCLLAPAQGAPPPQRVGESPANEATIVRLPDDSLRIYHVLRPAGTEIRSIGSTDNGKTWGDDRLEFKLPGVAYYAVQVLVDADGELQACFHIQGKGEGGYNGRRYDVWHVKTTGGRKTWGTPQRIFEGYVGSMRGFAQLKSGRLIVSVAIAVPDRAKKPEGDQPDFGWHDIGILYSDDKGDTWKQSPSRLKVLQDNTRGRTRYGGVEPHVVQLQDGRVWMLARTKNGHLYESLSSDGIDWPELKPSKFIASDSPATTVRLKDGRLALFLNQCQRWDDPMSYAIGGREVLHAAISADDGKSWRGFREVLYDFAGNAKGDRGTAYPSAVEAADGAIVLVSGQGEGRKSILRIDPAWLSETSATSAMKPDEWPRWTTHEGTDAVWNFPMAPAGKLTLRVKPQAGFAGATVSLTDHYSVSGDTKADANAVYSVKLDEKSLPAGASHDIELQWKPGGEATVTVDGKPVSSVKPLRSPAFGINYVRVDGAGDGLTIEAANASAADSTAQLNFTKRRGDAAGGSVLDIGGLGAFDDRWATCPTVLRTSDGYRMWYSAYYNAADGRGGIGAASSPDGIHWTRENHGKAVLPLGPAGAFDHTQAFGPEVLHDGKRYLMWYTGDNGEKDATRISYYQIGLATSDDGVAWERANAGKPVLTNRPAGAFDAVQAATPSVLRDGDGYRMWYAAWAPQSNHTICVARSADGVAWQRENDGRPVEGLDPSIAFGHSVCRVGGRYVMLYMALHASRGLYGAVSDDGLHWSMLNGGAPVLAPGSAEDFDANIVGHPFLLAEGDALRCWYTGYQTRPGGIGNWELRIGYAEAPIPAGLAR